MHKYAQFYSTDEYYVFLKIVLTNVTLYDIMVTETNERRAEHDMRNLHCNTYIIPYAHYSDKFCYDHFGSQRLIFIS